MTVKNFALAMVCLGLAACSFIPAMETHDMPVAENWSVEPTPVSDAGLEAAAEIGWREFFPSAHLQSVLTSTLANNRDLRVAALNVEASRALYRIEKSELLPTVNGDVGGSRQRLSEAQTTGVQTDRTISDYHANLAVTGFELDLFGRIRSQNEAALERFFATEAARDAVQVSLIAEVANTYLQWLADRKTLEITEATLETQEKSHELIRLSYENGVASKLDLAQVTTAVASAKANQARFTRFLMQDQNAMTLLMGDGTHSDLPPGESLDGIQVMGQLPVGLPSDVLLLRPDVRQAEHELKAANADIGAARAAFFPRISLTGTLGFASTQLGDLFSSSAGGAWRFAPQITVPIFNAGRNKANLAYSETQKEIALARYEKAIQTAFREVADELAARKTLDDQWQAQKREVDAAQEVYDLSYKRYEAGVDSFLAVLDAQRFLFAAQLRQIEIERQKLANLANLYKALGGGLTE